MPRKGESQHTRAEFERSYHAEPTSPAAEHIAPERSFTVFVSASGCFSVTAEDDADAEQVAGDLLRFGQNPVDQWFNIGIEYIREDD